jgi:hypothetical protein
MSLLHLLLIPTMPRRSGALGDRTASMATSMRLAEHESEGDNEELFTEVVVDV